ncbi:MAG: YihY/virulence factor BrkB family protein [Leucobacter sp.]|nr:YihY/virulence factor BrkB family protein [Leucobacter sp.]
MITRARSLWDYAQRTRPWRAFSHFTDVGGNVLAAGMSYQALFAVFAALWVGFGVLGIFLEARPELLNSLIDQINTFIPGLIGKDGFIQTSALLAARTLNLTGVIAAFSLIWVMINWFTGTRRAIRIIFGLDVKQYRNAVLLKLRDFLLALVFGIAILVSAALTVLSSNLTNLMFDWLHWDADNWLLSSMGAIVRYGAMYVFDVIVLMAMHKYLAEVTVGLRRLVVGCALGGAGLLGLKILGQAVLGGATSNPLLASFAVFIGILIWFNLICRVLLYTASWIATGIDRELGLGALAQQSEVAMSGR